MSGPDTKAFIQKIEEERARKMRQPVDNRSFFQKYVKRLFFLNFLFKYIFFCYFFSVDVYRHRSRRHVFAQWRRPTGRRRLEI